MCVPVRGVWWLCFARASAGGWGERAASVHASARGRGSVYQVLHVQVEQQVVFFPGLPLARDLELLLLKLHLVLGLNPLQHGVAVAVDIVAAAGARWVDGRCAAFGAAACIVVAADCIAGGLGAVFGWFLGSLCLE